MQNLKTWLSIGIVTGLTLLASVAEAQSYRSRVNQFGGRSNPATRQIQRNQVRQHRLIPTRYRQPAVRQQGFGNGIRPVQPALPIEVPVQPIQPGHLDPGFGHGGHGLIEPDFGIAVPGFQPPVVSGGCGIPQPPVVLPPYLCQTDALIAQVDAFLCAFKPTICYVPDGRAIYRDALILRQELCRFREAAAISGCNPWKLFQPVDAACCRLVRRVERVACGRTGPNIERVRLIARLCEQIKCSLT